MEENVVISAKTIVLNRKAINLSIVVFISIRVSHHSKNWINDFQKLITNTMKLSKFTDYLLKIVAPSIEEYDKFQQKLIGEVEFTKMSSTISLQEMKKSHVLPLL